MGEVLRDDAQMPQTILAEHVAILDAIIAGDGARAEMLSRDHISRAAKIFVQSASGTTGGLGTRDASASYSTA